MSLDDPGLRGRIVGGPRTRSDGNVFRIQWDDGTSGWVPEYAFELLNNVSNDVFELLQNRKFGRVNDLRRNLTFIQLSGRLANIVYSMNATNTEFLPFQYKPVLTFLESPTNGILIADEVGLGKTIEAGLIWTELRARYDSRRLVVVCPAMLREKWIFELKNKFGIEARILDAEGLSTELKRNKHTVPDGMGYICSLQGIRPTSGWRSPNNESKRAALARLLDKLSESQPVIDLLIIDEAHYLRNPDTRSSTLGGLLREVSEYIVLLSATPINNKSNDLFQLLHLVDPDTFYSPERFPEVLSANKPLIEARNMVTDKDSLITDIRNKLNLAQNHPTLRNNKQLQSLIDKTNNPIFLQNSADRVDFTDRIDRINLLRHVLNRTRKVEVQELKVIREAYCHFVPLDPNGPERKFYDNVTRAVRRYAIERNINDGFLLSPPQRQMSSCMYAAANSWKNKILNLDFNELLYEDQGAIETSTQNAGPLIQFVAAETLPNFDIESLRTHDTKFEKFQKLITDYLAKYPKQKFIVFSYYRGTLHYLHERLLNLGIQSQVLHGGIPENKQTVIDNFKESRQTHILLTSEVASEGVDLQFCSLIINYDLPWNPMKIEQRIGRIDRIGQLEDKILIWNMAYAETIDERIHELLLEKLGIFEAAIGGMEAVLGQLIGELTSALLSQELTADQEKSRIEQTYFAAENIRQKQEELEKQAGNLLAHHDYIVQQAKAARDFNRRITDFDLFAFVKDYFDRSLTGFEFTEISEDEKQSVVSIRLPANFIVKFEKYIENARLTGKTRLISGQTIKCRFLSQLESNRRDIETINQFHPLIRFISQDLRERSEHFYPLVACRLPSSAVSHSLTGVLGVYVFASKRWTFEGLRTHEILQTRAIALSDQSILQSPDESWELLNAIRSHGTDWLSVANEVSIDQITHAIDKCDIKLQADYENTKNDWNDENDDRVNLQIDSFKRHRDRLLTVQLNLLHTYELEGRHRLIPMTKGRITSLESKFEIRLERLRSQSKITSTVSDVCYGVVRIDEH